MRVPGQGTRGDPLHNGTTPCSSRCPCMAKSDIAGTGSLIEQMPAAIAIFDDEMRHRAVSRRYLSDMASIFSTEILSPNQIIGCVPYDLWPNLPPRWRDIHTRVLAGEELAEEEDFVARRDGHAAWIRWSMKPWRDAHGRVAGALLLSEVVTEQTEMRHALAESERRFRATFENAAVGISHFTPDGRLIRGNNAMCRIVGWPIDELVAKPFQELTHPEDLPAELDQFTQLREGKIDSYSLDKRYLRKDGTTVWTHRSVSSVRRSDGSIDYLVSVLEDISARKRAEEQVGLLIREANHRVKNLLGLVQAIARRTEARNVEEFVGRFTERIQALAANQDLLSRSQRRGANLRDLACAQLAHFADLIGTRISLRGPNLHLNAAAAQAIGLALHELATNAAKYGALSTNAGRVDLRWGLYGHSFGLSWAEHDGPPVQTPEHKGFGTTVVGAMARQALGGNVELDYAPSGLGWRLTCPAANAVEPEIPHP